MSRNLFRRLFEPKPIPTQHQEALQRAQAAALRQKTSETVAIWNDGRYRR